VPRAEARGNTWQNHKVGPGNRQADTRHLVEGVNTPLTSRISGIREIRARELDPSKLAKSRVARTRGEKSTSLLGGSKEGAKVGHSNSRSGE
jgi:hypothetical protein